MPALGARDEQGLHACREPLQGETGSGVVDFLCVLLAGIAPAHEKSRTGAGHAVRPWPSGTPKQRARKGGVHGGVRVRRLNGACGCPAIVSTRVIGCLPVVPNL